MNGQEIEVPPRSRGEIRKIADAFRELSRRALGGFGPEFPIVEAMEWVLPTLDPEFVLEVLPTHEMGDEHGLTIPSEHIIRLREDVYDRACNGHGRDRMTVAHEIGHYLLHRTPAVFARRNNKKKERLPAFRSSEWQANCFGAELLVFPKGIDASMTDMEVAEMRGVSKDAAAYQMKTYRQEGLLR